MFSLSKIKNKKSFFSIIVFLSSFSAACYGMDIRTVVGNHNLGRFVEGGPFYNTAIDKFVTWTTSNGHPITIPHSAVNPVAWKTAKIDCKIKLDQISNKITSSPSRIMAISSVILPIVFQVVVNGGVIKKIISKLNEDPEIKAAQKQLLLEQVKLQQDPEYKKIALQQLKNDADEKANINIYHMMELKKQAAAQTAK